MKQAAEQLGLLVTHTPADVVSSGAELGVVVAYGRLVKPDVLAAVPMVNVHFSLLPRWRGAAPVERAVLAGDPETGVCLMELEEGLDTGPVYARAVTPIGPDETADELRRRLGEMGTELLLKNLSVGLGAPEPQMGEPTYASKISPDELRLDFDRAAEICNRVVRVGRAWTTWRGKRLLVHRARVLDEQQGLFRWADPGAQSGDGGGSSRTARRPARRQATDGRSRLGEGSPSPARRALGRMKPPKVTARGLAITALVAAEDGERANLVVPRLLSASGLDERDRGFVTELAYGTLRMCRACDWLVGQFARGELEPVVRAAARAGAYQLAFMRVPAYAAVSATVSEAPPRARSLLNAVLRRVAALVEAGPLVWPDLGTRLSYPDWVIRRLGEDLGPERAMGALDQMNIAASQTVRADGYTQDPGSQAVAEHMADLMSTAPRGSS